MARRRSNEPAKPTAEHRKLARKPLVELIRYHLEQTEADLEGSREDHSWQAASTLHRQAVQLAKDLDALERAARSADEDGDGKRELTEQDLVAMVLEALPGLEDTWFDELAAAVDTRRSGGRLRIVE